MDNREEFEKWADQLSNDLPKHILDTLRFYAYGEHFYIDPEGEGFEAVRGVPENWLCSQRENDTTMIENGGLARAALRGEVVADIPEFPPIDGEKYGLPDGIISSKKI